MSLDVRAIVTKENGSYYQKAFVCKIVKDFSKALNKCSPKCVPPFFLKYNELHSVCSYRRSLTSRCAVAQKGLFYSEKVFGTLKKKFWLRPCILMYPKIFLK